MKINKKNVAFIFTILTIFIIFITPIYSKASDNPADNPDYYKPGQANNKDVEQITNKVGPIFNIITAVGVVVAAVTLGVLGIKYMLGSVEERAEYKKTMIPYLIGAVMLASIAGILNVFYNIVTDVTGKI